QAAQMVPQAQIPQTGQAAESQTEPDFQSAWKMPFRPPYMPLQDSEPAPTTGGAATPDPGAQSVNPPVLSMAPHTEVGRYWVSGQANSILQMHGHFRSPYEGTNSLIDDFEAKASEVA